MAWKLGAKIGHTSVYKFYMNGICMSAVMKMMMMMWNFEIMSNKFSVDDDYDDGDGGGGDDDEDDEHL